MNNDDLNDAPLAGTRVVEFCTVAAGPYCGMLLADMGAEVIKVESRDGDTLRQWPPFCEGFSENFASLNRNKRSIALDLKDEEDNRIARRLIASADVVIENNRPGAMARLGLGYERFASDNPRLIYCSLSAYGQSGPRANEGGFDLTIQARSGIMSVTGEEQGGPVKAGVPISDFATGLYGAFSVASLLVRRIRDGRGGHVDVSMLGSSLAIAALQVSEYFGSGRNPRKLGAAHPRNAPYQAFRARDGSFVMAAGNNKLWRGVCEVVGNPDLASDPRFLTPSDRAASQQALADILEAAFADRDVAELVASFAAAGIPCSPINSYSDALSDPHVEAMGWVQDIASPAGHGIRTLGPVVRLDGALSPITRSPPALDGDREDILAELAVLENAGRVL
ncbi:CoA transferase [Sphingobium amiense]|uniref:CoA transferase n=1 Tax=Sphingobium amiense TaxID=135719 RepID=A0A494VWK4_9SPHN|nr:CoA transferase [Sphingobium amiense]BBD96793.1 CoA transferase [Sphingobium amiense]